MLNFWPGVVLPSLHTFQKCSPSVCFSPFSALSNSEPAGENCFLLWLLVSPLPPSPSHPRPAAIVWNCSGSASRIWDQPEKKVSNCGEAGTIPSSCGSWHRARKHLQTAWAVMHFNCGPHSSMDFRRCLRLFNSKETKPSFCFLYRGESLKKIITTSLLSLCTCSGHWSQVPFIWSPNDLSMMLAVSDCRVPSYCMLALLHSYFGLVMTLMPVLGR